MDTRFVFAAVAIIAILLIAVAAAVAARRRGGSEQLKRHSGPEYDRTVVQQHGDARRAEAALAEREERVETFPLRPLSPVDREAYAMEWAAVQQRFVDDPFVAAGTADRLITRLMIDRGYPMADFEQRDADISVSYSTVVQNYRAAHEIAVRHADGQATMEELHQAMIHYHAVFDELLEPEVEPAVEPTQVQPIDQNRQGVTHERAS
jgi:hypothetical protein